MLLFLGDPAALVDDGDGAQGGGAHRPPQHRLQQPQQPPSFRQGQS